VGYSKPVNNDKVQTMPHTIHNVSLNDNVNPQNMSSNYYSNGNSLVCDYSLSDNEIIKLMSKRNYIKMKRHVYLSKHHNKQ
jgi:hypothetical protein